MLRANRQNINYEAKRLMGNLYTPEREKELIKLCQRDHTHEAYFVPGEHPSFAAHRLMEDIDKVLKTFGVESLYPDLPNIYYCNNGDSYTDTILYCTEKKKTYIGSWGDVMETRFRSCPACGENIPVV